MLRFGALASIAEMSVEQKKKYKWILGTDWEEPLTSTVNLWASHVDFISKCHIDVFYRNTHAFGDIEKLKSISASIQGIIASLPASETEPKSVKYVLFRQIVENDSSTVDELITWYEVLNMLDAIYNSVGKYRSQGSIKAAEAVEKNLKFVTECVLDKKFVCVRRSFFEYIMQRVFDATRVFRTMMTDTPYIGINNNDVTVIDANWMMSGDGLEWRTVIESRRLYVKFVDGCHDRMSGLSDDPFNTSDVEELKRLAIYIDFPYNTLSTIPHTESSVRYNLLKRVIGNDIQVIDALIIWHEIMEKINVVQNDVKKLHSGNNDDQKITKISLQSDLNNIIKHISTRECSLCIPRVVYESFVGNVFYTDSMIKCLRSD